MAEGTLGTAAASPAQAREAALGQEAAQARPDGGKPDLASVMEGRASLYALLARAFHKEVDETFLGELRAMGYPQGSANPAVNEAFKLLYGFMRHAREDVLDQLAADYARTFLGSGILNGNAAFPYESVYTSTHALLMQEARDEVLAIYRSQGVDKDPSWTDPEDHIALELEFMKVLCERTARAIGEGDDEGARALVKTQLAFLTDHLMPWAPRFLGDVPRFAGTDFYVAFARLADAFLADDLELLEDVARSSGIEPEAVSADA